MTEFPPDIFAAARVKGAPGFSPLWRAHRNLARPTTRTASCWASRGRPRACSWRWPRPRCARWRPRARTPRPHSAGRSGAVLLMTGRVCSTCLFYKLYTSGVRAYCEGYPQPPAQVKRQTKLPGNRGACSGKGARSCRAENRGTSLRGRARPAAGGRGEAPAGGALSCTLRTQSGGGERPSTDAALEVGPAPLRLGSMASFRKERYPACLCTAPFTSSEGCANQCIAGLVSSATAPVFCRLPGAQLVGLAMPVRRLSTS